MTKDEREVWRRMLEDDRMDIPISTPPEAKFYRVRDLVHYCEQRGIRTEDLTDQELKQFELSPKT